MHVGGHQVGVNRPDEIIRDMHTKKIEVPKNCFNDK